MPRKLRVFLCHASQDKPAVWKLYRFLRQRGTQPWLDQADLLPGQDWEVEIPRALFASDVILVCLSKNSVNKEGFVQKEISFALDKALEKPEGTIFIIPVKLEECEIPRRLTRYQWVDLSRTDGRKRLLLGLNMRVNELGEEVMPVVVEDARQRTPRSQSPKPETTKPEEQIASISIKDDAQEELKKEISVQISSLPLGEGQVDTLTSETLSKPDRKPMPKKPFTKILDPSFLSSGTERGELGSALSNEAILRRVGKSSSKNNFRWLGIGGIIFIGLLLFLFGGKYILNNLPPTETSILTPSKTLMSLTITPTITLMPMTSTATSLPPTKTPNFTSTPNLGTMMISEKDGMTLLYVPEGEFTMGANNGNPYEKPAHQVYLNAFWIDKTEVTFEMYGHCIESGDCEDPAVSYGYYSGDLPINSVTWYEANAYCTWVGRRLPTEAEWEKAARGTDQRLYPWGNSAPNANLVHMNPYGATSVGSFPAGASLYGALDMAGNLWEWVNDWYDENYYSNSPPSNPTGSTSGASKVIRGGAWDFNSDSKIFRTTARARQDPSIGWLKLGFRCALSP